MSKNMENPIYYGKGRQTVIGRFDVTFPENVTLTEESVLQILGELDKNLEKEHFGGDVDFFDTDDFEISEDGHSFTACVLHDCEGKYKSYDECQENPVFMNGIPEITDEESYMDYVGGDLLCVLREFFEGKNATVTLSFDGQRDLEFDDWEQDYEGPDMDRDDY